MEIVKDTQVIALSLKKWAAQQSPKVALPGKVAVAYAVLDKDEIRLAADAEEILCDLHARFLDAFRGPTTA